MFIEGQEILDKRYRVVKKLGGGAFGEIFKGMLTLLLLKPVFSWEEEVWRVPCSQSGKLRVFFWSSQLFRKKQSKVSAILCCFGSPNWFTKWEARPLCPSSTLLETKSSKMAACSTSWLWICWARVWKICFKSVDANLIWRPSAMLLHKWWVVNQVHYTKYLLL